MSRGGSMKRGRRVVFSLSWQLSTSSPEFERRTQPAGAGSRRAHRICPDLSLPQVVAGQTPRCKIPTLSPRELLRIGSDATQKRTEGLKQKREFARHKGFAAPNRIPLRLANRTQQL